MRQVGRHAVVLGSSMAGLLAARALHPYFERVTLIERDRLPEGVAQRKGVPQGNHAHGLLAGGREALEAFFPGFTAELVARGAIMRDLLKSARWIINGHRFATAPSELTGLVVSRPLLEAHTRVHVVALPNVQVIDGCEVLALLGSSARVRGAQIRRAASAVETLDADLVVDATGRGSRLPIWLAELGAKAPSEQRVRVDVSYATRMFRRRPGDCEGKLSVVVGAAPPNPRCGVALSIEGDRWVVTLAGYFKHRVPADHAGFVQFARALPAPDLYELVRDAEPIDDGASATFPFSQRRYYERLTQFPAGLLAIGDSICSFNPTYGQGMSVAALEARLLEREVAQGLRNLALRFFAGAAPIVDVPWQIAVGADLAFPEVEAPRSLASRMTAGYMRRLQRAAARDPRVSLAFLKVSNLLAPPAALFAPATLLRVLVQGRAREARALTALPLDTSRVSVRTE